MLPLSTPSFASASFLLPLQTPRLSEPSRPSSPAARRPSAGSNWDPNAEGVRNRRFRFDPREFTTDDEEDEHRFGGKAKQKIWSSDESPVSEDDEELDDWEESPDGSWILKILRAFGWMFPAVIISLLLGTGSNAFVMAFALPLGQSALSLVIDKLWGSTSSQLKQRPRNKKRPFTRPGGNIRMDDQKQREHTRTGKNSSGSRSWSAAYNGMTKKGVNSSLGYGGWDELDEVRVSDVFTRRASILEADDPQRQQKKAKLSGRRNNERPLLLRLIISVFPFLGSWMKFL